MAMYRRERRQQGSSYPPESRDTVTFSQLSESAASPPPNTETTFTFLGTEQNAFKCVVSANHTE